MISQDAVARIIKNPELLEAIIAEEYRRHFPPIPSAPDPPADARYGVYAFPGLFGEPWYFRNRLVAWFAAHWRASVTLMMFGLLPIKEVRLIDLRTREHLYVN